MCCVESERTRRNIEACVRALREVSSEVSRHQQASQESREGANEVQDIPANATSGPSLREAPPEEGGDLLEVISEASQQLPLESGQGANEVQSIPADTTSGPSLHESSPVEGGIYMRTRSHGNRQRGTCVRESDITQGITDCTADERATSQTKRKSRKTSTTLKKGSAATAGASDAKKRKNRDDDVHSERRKTQRTKPKSGQPSRLKATLYTLCMQVEVPTRQADSQVRYPLS